MSYQDVRHHYEDPPDEADLRQKEIKDMKAALKELTEIDVDEAVEENTEMREIITGFLNDQRVLMEIAKDCKGDPCECLYCRAKGFQKI